MNRDAIREIAAKELKLRTARYDYAESEKKLVFLLSLSLSCPLQAKDNP